MITITTLAIIIIAIVIITAVIAISIGGGFIVLFGDLLIAGIIIWFLVKLFKKRK